MIKNAGSDLRGLRRSRMPSGVGRGRVPTSVRSPALALAHPGAGPASRLAWSWVMVRLVVFLVLVSDVVVQSPKLLLSHASDSIKKVGFLAADSVVPGLLVPFDDPAALVGANGIGCATPIYARRCAPGHQRGTPCCHGGRPPRRPSTAVLATTTTDAAIHA